MDDNEHRFNRLDERIDHLGERIDRLSEQTRTELQAMDIRLARIETRLDQTVTRADLERAINSVVKWVVGTMLGAAIAAVTVMTFVLNNAVPRPAVTGPAAPVIIQLPPAGQAIAPGTPP
jgi:hypothetical protein